MKPETWWEALLAGLFMIGAVVAILFVLSMAAEIGSEIRESVTHHG